MGVKHMHIRKGKKKTGGREAFNIWHNLLENKITLDFFKKKSL